MSWTVFGVCPLRRRSSDARLRAVAKSDRMPVVSRARRIGLRTLGATRSATAGAAAGLAGFELATDGLRFAIPTLFHRGLSMPAAGGSRAGVGTSDAC